MGMDLRGRAAATGGPAGDAYPPAPLVLMIRLGPTPPLTAHIRSTASFRVLGQTWSTRFLPSIPSAYPLRLSPGEELSECWAGIGGAGGFVLSAGLSIRGSCAEQEQRARGRSCRANSPATGALCAVVDAPQPQRGGRQRWEEDPGPKPAAAAELPETWRRLLPGNLSVRVPRFISFQRPEWPKASSFCGGV
nr:uncharacterized protein LOC106825137 [Equus asinus]